MNDWHESQESWARLVAELRAENASLHIHQCRDLESGRGRDALVERLQRTIGESMGEVDRLRDELASLESCYTVCDAQRFDAEAAIARVRELCGFEPACSDYSCNLLYPEKVLRALQGSSANEETDGGTG